MPAALNQRIFYPTYAIGIAAFDTPSTILTVRGAQSMGLSGRIPIEYIHEIGNLPTYFSYEEVPEVEVTIEKVLDGFPPVSVLATQNAIAADLVSRANKRCHFYTSIHRDNQSRASGNETYQAFMSGMYLSTVGFDFMADGKPFMENVTLVGNNMAWTTGAFTYTGHTSAMGVTSLVPTGAAGVNRSQQFLMSQCRFPVSIPGISSSGTNDPVTVDGSQQFAVSFGTIKANVSLGRSGLPELGRKGPYFRFAAFPVDVTTQFEFISKFGYTPNMLEAGALAGGENTSPETILFKTEEGLVLDLGSKNRLTSVGDSGGNAGQGGANRAETYSYTNRSEMTIQHSADPTTALRP